jgi:hypothetical protein
MSKPDKERFVRHRGWVRTSTSGSQQWAKNGVTCTLTGAVYRELKAGAEG